MTTSVDVLVVAAYPPELAHLRAWLEVDRGKRSVGLQAVGIGMAEAAAGATMAIMEQKPRAVLVIGTCGAYRGAPPPLPIASAVVVESTRVVSMTAVLGLGFLPEGMATPIAASATMVAALARNAGAGVPVQVATTLAITTDVELAGRASHEVKCSVEHLETAAVALAARRLGVPWAGVLGIANEVGPNAHTEWLANHVTASAAAGAVVAAWLEQGAPGI